MVSLGERLADDLDAAFPSLVETYQDGLFSGALRLTGRHADAEDVVQEAFIKAYRALRNYDGGRITQLQLRPWLWTITLNVIRNEARTRSRRPREVIGIGIDRALEADGNPEQTAMSSAAEAEWHRRLSELPEAQRTAVVLRHVIGMSYREIAEAVDRPAGTVKSDVSRALDRLRQALELEVRT